MRFASCVCFCLLLACGSTVRADDLIEVRGTVNGPDGAAVGAGAIVTAYDDKEHVVGQATTDASGIYRMTVPRSALHLEAKKPGGHRSGLGNILGQVAKTAGSVLTSPSGGSFLPGVGGLTPGVSGSGFGLGGISPLSGFGLASLSGANPLKVLANLTVASMVNRLVGVGVPQPRAQQIATDLKSGNLSKDQALQQMQDAGVPREKAEAALAEMARAGTAAAAAPTSNLPGALQFTVALDGMKPLKSVAQAYEMMELPGSKSSVALVMDPVCLQRADGAGDSVVSHENMLFVAAQIEPAIVHFGESARIKVLIGMPPDAQNLVVVAHTRKGAAIELTRGDPGVFEAELKIDRSLERGEQVIAVIAYVSPHAGRDKKHEEELAKVGLWQADKQYAYSPLLRVSKNRADLKLTILEPNPR